MSKDTTLRAAIIPVEAGKEESILTMTRDTTMEDMMEDMGVGAAAAGEVDAEVVVEDVVVDSL